MRKVLLISYFFPPLSGPGTQRAFNFVKHLPARGWEPVVLSVKDISYVGRDEKLLEQLNKIKIYRTESIDLMRMLYLWEKLFSVKKQKSLYMRAENKIRGILRDIFPIDSKIGWLLFSYQKGLSICRTEKISIIISTMSPYTSGILGYMLSRKTGIPYLLDYRDLWAGKPDMTYLSEFHKRIAINWEKKIISDAAGIIHVTQRSAQRFHEIYPEYPKNKLQIIYNGYDRELFKGIKIKSKPVSEVKFLFAGHFYGDQSPAKLLSAIKQLRDSGKLPGDIKFEFVGNYPRSIENLFYEDISIVRTPYLTYKKYLNKLIDSDVLILFISRRDSEIVLTQKLFEYLAARRPILALVPENGEAAELIRENKAGVMINEENLCNIKNGIMEMYHTLKEGKCENKFELAKNDYSRFERQVQADQLAEIMDKIHA